MTTPRSGSPPRRSSRKRRAAHTVYDDAAEALTASAEKKNAEKKRKSKSESDDEEEEEENNDENDELVELEDSSSSEEDNDDDGGGEDDEDSDDDDEEEAPSRRNPKPSPPKRRKITINKSGAKSSAPKKKKVTSSSSAWKSLFANVLEQDETAETSLVAALRDVGGTPNAKRRGAKNSKLEELTRKLIRDHFQDPNAVHVRLYNLIFRVCGATADGLLPADEDLENLSDEALSEYMTACVTSMQQSSIADVLWTAAPPTTNAKLQFRNLYQEFWHGLGVSALSSTVAAAGKEGGDSGSEPDDELGQVNNKDSKGAPSSTRFQVEVVRSLVTRLVELAFVQEPNLRSAMTTAAYSIATAILHKTVELREKLQTAQRQHQSAKRNKQRRKSDALKAQVDTSQRMIGDLEDIVTESIMTIFVKRYRDVNPHLRAASMLALADFCVIRPDIFFDKKYLKYPGWTLSDKEAVVREAALTAFLRPCQDKMFDEQVMEGVVDRFVGRFADCTIDVDTSVQERAMEFLLILARSGLLDAVHDEDLWNQINLRAIDPDTTPAVRTYALLFIIEQLGAFDEEVAGTDANAVERINQLAQWVSHNLAEGDIPLDQIRLELSSNIVKSLRVCPEHQSLVRNFGALVKAFQDSVEVNVPPGGSSKGHREVVKADAKQRVLLEFLMTSVEEEVQLSSPEQVVDIDLREPETKTKKKASVQDDMTRALLPTLPNLVKSFKSETVLLRRLAKLPLYFSPTVCSLSDQKRNYKKLLTAWSECFAESSDSEVLQNCCHSLSFLATADHTRHDDAVSVLHDVLASLRKRLEELAQKRSNVDKTLEESDNEENEEDNEEESGKIDHSISLVLRRLAILSKRWPLADLIDEGDEDADEVVDKLCQRVFRVATDELEIRKPIMSEDKLEVPDIWKKANKTHKSATESVLAALDFLLSAAGWAMHKISAELKASPSEATSRAKGSSNILVVMRQRVETLLSLCFEQFMEDENFASDEHREFSETIQGAAGHFAGDLRMLFPRAMKQCKDEILSEAALVDDSHLIGGYVRFIRQQEAKLRELEGKEDPGLDPWIARKLIFPIARGLCVNWETGNRREAGEALSHITNSGSEAAAIVSAMSKTLKKLNPVRLLEAHMASLRQEFEAWAESEPEEPQGDNPSDEENAAFEEAEKEYEEKFQALEHQAHRLSASLGVGKITDNVLANGVLGFIREGLRFAFSRNEPGSDEPLFLGARLPFLRLLAKYLVWVRKNNRQITIIRDDFNQKEDEIRSDPDYESILETDIEAMALFRKIGNLGDFDVEDDTTVGNRSIGASSRASSRASNIFRRRHSLGGSVSSVPSKVSTNRSDLSPLPEEKDDEMEDDEDMKMGSPAGHSSLGSSSRIFSPESRTEMSTQASHENPDSDED